MSQANLYIVAYLLDEEACHTKKCVSIHVILLAYIKSMLLLHQIISCLLLHNIIACYYSCYNSMLLFMLYKEHV